MQSREYMEAGTSVTSPIDDKRRKEVLITRPPQFSQQVDLSDVIGMDPETAKAIASMPYSIRTEDGKVLAEGKTTDAGETDRVFTRSAQELTLYLGAGNWSLGKDAVHEYPNEPVADIAENTAREQGDNSSVEQRPGNGVMPGVTNAGSGGSEDIVGPESGPPAPTVPQPSGNSVAEREALESCKYGSLDLTITDFSGRIIANLPIKVVVGKDVVFRGTTNLQGKVSTISTIPVGSRFEIRVKRHKKSRPLKGDDEEGYGMAAIDKLEGKEVYACLVSPKLAINFSTGLHEGDAGDADIRKERTIAKHNQAPAAHPSITGNADEAPRVETVRNAKGVPKAVVSYGLRDWFNRNTLSTPAPKQNAEGMERVKKLIDFAEKQATWRYEKATITATYVQQMIKKTFQQPPSKEKDGYKNSLHQCAKYVKIALWFAGYGPAEEAIGNSVALARQMGPALLRAGFRDVTAELPDARWAAPGDVIVYQKRSDPDAAGHIDIRTYDGYISDFFQHYLPENNFQVTGIYRKYSDPLPAKRMRAFLMVIASRESEGVFINEGYQASYKTLPGSKPQKFASFDRHPFEGQQSNGTPSGAYGMTISTWRNFSKKILKLNDNEMSFTPVMQDRIAIAIMEQTGNALAHVRTGNIEKAAAILAKNQWPSFPTGAQSRGFTVAQMLSSFEKFLSQL